MAYDLRSGGWRWNDAPDNLAQAYGFSRGYIMERPSQVPEPASLGLLGLGLIAASFARRKRG